jgi:hypothetical protein
VHPIQRQASRTLAEVVDQGPALVFGQRTGIAIREKIAYPARGAGTTVTFRMSDLKSPTSPVLATSRLSQFQITRRKVCQKLVRSSATAAEPSVAKN